MASSWIAWVVVIRWWWNILWLRVSKYMLEHSLGQHATSDFKHKVLIVGDDMAEGFGDGMSTLGLCLRLQKELRSKKYLIRHAWNFYSAGRFQSTVDDWSAPTAAGKTGQCFKDTFDCDKYNDAEVILVIAGLTDSRSLSEDKTPQEIVRKLKLLCAYLSHELGRYVFLSTIPQRTWRDKEVNDLIIDYCNKNDDDVKLGPNLSTRKFSNRDLFFYHCLNPDGYKLCASDWLESIAPVLTKVEYRVHATLSGVTTQDQPDGGAATKRLSVIREATS